MLHISGTHTIASLFEKINNTPEGARRAVIAAAIDRFPSVVDWIKFYYSPSFITDTDTFDVNYKNPSSYAAPSSLWKQFSAIKRFLPGSGYPKWKREKFFIQIMESISLDESMFLEHYLSKTLEQYYPNIDFREIEKWGNN